MRTLLTSFAVFSILRQAFVVANRVELKNNEYRGLLIAIHPSVEEDGESLQKIIDAWTDASEVLFKATYKRAFFRDITLLLPSTWKDTSYPTSTSVSYGEADVVIENSPILAPYTEQYASSCGKPGIKIHTSHNYYIDSNAVINFGPRGKTLIHEWAHYRYGVFDETSKNYVIKNGYPQPSRCPEAVGGKVVNIEESSTNCLFDEDSYTYTDESCVFLPEKNTPGVDSSLSCFHYLEDVTAFCRDPDTNNPNNPNFHNSNANNEHNRICDRKSTWYHISRHIDFNNGSNLSNDSISDTTPTFTILKMEEQTRYVLVIDVSNGMKGVRLQSVRTAAREMIMNHIPTRSRLGIVDFSSNAQILSELKTINSRSDREDLVNSLPTSTRDFTSIGDGILKGIEVLESGGESAAGGNLIVLVDGRENEIAYVDNIFEEVVLKGVHVHSIFYVENVNNGPKELQDLTEATNGKWIYVPDEKDLNSIMNAYITMVQPKNDDISSQPQRVESRSVEISLGVTYESAVFIDSSIGVDSVFAFSWNTGNPEFNIRLISPDLCQYSYSSSTGSASNCGAVVSSESTGFNTISFNIPGIAKTGTWTYIIEPSISSKVNIQISSKPMSDADPIKITPYIATKEYPNAVAVYAKVSMGLYSITGIGVVAKIGRSDKSFVDIDLLDNGAGADKMADDGIYSRYFTEFFIGNDRYDIKIEVSTSHASAKLSENPGSTANYNYGIILDDGSIRLNPNGALDEVGPDIITNVGEFSRSISMAGFTYSGLPSVPDVIPPNKIVDLQIEQVDQSTKEIMITFTASGNNYDQGKAYNYEMYYTFENPTDLLNVGQSRNETTRVVVEDDFIKGSLKSPKQFGEVETMKILVIFGPTESGFYSLSFAIRVSDEENNISPVSNIAMTDYTIGKPIPIHTTSKNDPPKTQTSKTTTAKSTSSNKTLIIAASVVLISIILIVAIFLGIYMYKKNRKVTPRSNVYEADEYSKPDDPPMYEELDNRPTLPPRPYQLPYINNSANLNHVLYNNTPQQTIYDDVGYRPSRDYDVADENGGAYEIPVAQQRIYDDADLTHLHQHVWQRENTNY